MKTLKVIIAVFTIFPLFLQSQTLEDDFEGNGTVSEWYGDDCEADPQFVNPFNNANNGSATVLKYGDVGGPFANVRFDLISNFELTNFHTFTLKVYVPSSGVTGSQTNQISLKLQDGTLGEPWTTQTEVIKPVVLDQWQTISFDFENDAYLNFDPNSPAPITRSDLNRVLIQINGENNTDQVTAYLDDFQYDGVVELPDPEPVYDNLVWSDEFDGAGMIDTSKWFHQTLLPDGVGWYNNEVQHYTDRVENSFLADGYMTIMAKKEVFTDQGQTKNHTSARLNSKFAFTYGKVEVRAKLPEGIGTWPAIWTLGKNIIEPGGYWTDQFGTALWPACGEIDIMEHWGSNQNFVQSALHTPSSFGATINHGGIMANDVANNFHVFTLIWTPEKMDFKLDGTTYYTYNPDPKNMDTWPYIADQYILLNIAIEPSIDPNFTQSPMVLDYVRVYQEDTSTTGFNEEIKRTLKVFPNPTSDALNIAFDADQIGQELIIRSALGQIVDSVLIENEQMSISLISLPKGAYFIGVDGESNSVISKVIKL
jgi:beta-glucanase (GH16 family)